MKQVSTLFDALRNEKFAVVVKDGMAIRYYGVEGAGREWAKWANSVDTKSLESSQLPAGVIRGPFKNINEISLKSLINSLGYEGSTSGDIFSSKSYSYKGLFLIENDARVPAVMDTPIGHFTTNQYLSAVNYKALTMRTQIKEGSFLLEARANNYAFNFEKSMYNAMPSKAEIKSLRQRIDNNLGRSSERRLGIKLKNALLKTSERNNIGAIYTLETKSLQDSLETKGIGQRIGGAARRGRRAIANFDPKAWDGDGDGLVQEGTPFQRPAIPGVNDRASGGKVNTSRARQAWQDSQPGRRGRGEVAQRTVSDKPSGLASRTQSDIDKEVSKQITDEVKNVLSRKSSSTDLRALVQGLGPDGGGELTRSQEDRINDHIDDLDNDVYENMEDFMSDISNVLLNRPSGNKKPNQSGMRSRVSTARTQRQTDGLASRSASTKKKSKLRAVPGLDKVDDKDGQLWESLTPEQKDVVEKNTKQAYQDLMQDIKKRNSDWWNSFIRQTSGLKKTSQIDADGKEWSRDSRIAGEAITSLTLAVEDASKNVSNEIATLENSLNSLGPRNPVNADEIKKTENKIKKLKKDLEREQKSLDDLRTFDQMHKKEDWSLLEHLHPETRQKSFGKKIPTSQQGNYEDVFGKNKPAFPIDNPSTIFEEIGGAKRAKARVGDKTDSKLADLARRVTRPNPQRAERRRLRREGKGKTLTEESPREKISKVKRRASKAKRDIQSKIRGKRSPEDIGSAIDSIRNKNKPLVGRDAENNPIITKETIEGFEKLLRGYKPSEKKNKDGKTVGKNADSFLGQIWDSQNFSKLPTAVREDEAIELVAQGWTPIQRGHGGDSKSQAAQWADDYVYDPSRFITGEGGQAVGSGEYWAHPESNGWDSWITNQSADTATIAFLPPNSKILSQSEAQKIKNDGDSIANAIGGYITGAGSGGKAESLDPADLVREIKQHLSTVMPMDSDTWNSEVGKVYSQIFSLMEAGDSAQGKQLYDALRFMLKQRDSDRNIYAMIMGYDGVDYGKSDGRLLMFNRGALSVFKDPVPLEKVKNLAKGIGEATPAKDKKPSRKSSGSSVKGKKGNLDNQSWKQVGGQGGSQPGAEFEDSSGKKFYVKKQKSQLHAENEVLMSELYERLGVRAAKNSGGTAHIQGNSPGPGVFSEWLKGSKSVNHGAEVKNPKWKKSVQDTYVASAWLANWDGTGNGDNIKMGADGEAYIIDTGGAGLFRAQGVSKGSAFGPVVAEMESLRDPSLNSLGAMYFGDIPAQEIAKQVAAIGALSDADIRQMVNATITDSGEAKKMIDTLIARRDYLVQNWGTGSRK